uniref:Uncharacterized protein n=1 Tax=Oryza sativa subsp. japonica TaxID=39947 RepID=Q69RP2_ORYSJ|nr:hypothetical protein [Oryza sativa Japonica Group]
MLSHLQPTPHLQIRCRPPPSRRLPPSLATDRHRVAVSPPARSDLGSTPPPDQHLPSHRIWRRGEPRHAAAVVNGGGEVKEMWRGREKERRKKKREGRGGGDGMERERENWIRMGEKGVDPARPDRLGLRWVSVLTENRHIFLLSTKLPSPRWPPCQLKDARFNLKPASISVRGKMYRFPIRR